jgi:GGDEF domain-containing protein
MRTHVIHKGIQMSDANAIPFEQILAEAPWGVMVLRGGRILWVNGYLLDLLQTSQEELLGAEEVPSHAAQLLDPQRQEFELHLPDRPVRHLVRHWVGLSHGDLSVHYFRDVTERRLLETESETLREQVKLLDTRDAETGLLNEKAILHALESQVTRSRRYGNPLSAIRLAFKPPMDEGEHHITLAAIGQEFKVQLRWADQIGRLGLSTFLLVLPETNLDDARALADKLESDRVALASRAEGWKIQLSVDSWKKGDDARKLLNRLAQQGANPPA